MIALAALSRPSGTYNIITYKFAEYRKYYLREKKKIFFGKLRICVYR